MHTPMTKCPNCGGGIVLMMYGRKFHCTTCHLEGPSDCREFTEQLTKQNDEKAEGKMHNLHVIDPSNPEPRQALIDALENVLADAKSGKLRSFMGCGMQNDGARMSLWVPDETSVWALMGALASMLIEYQGKYVQDGKNID